MAFAELKTEFAPPERAAVERIHQEADLLISMPLLCELLDSIPDIVLILNKHRQIVFGNQTLSDAFGLSRREDAYGVRPGEALNCVHADENDGGCGTTSFCRTCGAVNAIVSGLRGKKKMEECRITQRNTGIAFDLRVTGSPFKVNDDNFVIFVATDISHEKRRNVLERTFFHDISNTLTGVINYTEMLPQTNTAYQKELLDRLALGVKRLHEEINSQRGLFSAESGDLTVQPEPIRSSFFLREMADSFKNDSLGSESVQIQLDANATDVMFVSDKTLLSRVYSNMLKNAVEASGPGDKVTGGCKIENNSIIFWTHNSQFIPIDAQLQIFNRSFSTKGKGRGVGTYSIKLFTEKYLKGRASFATNETAGTTFMATLPLILEAD